jgi:hypothetical protein
MFLKIARVAKFIVFICQMAEHMMERLKNFMNIDVNLIYPKMAFFLLLGGQSSLLSYLSIYLHDLGLTGK